jgi:hypothetical protein
VRGGEAAADLGADLDGASPRQRSTPETLAQGLALEQLAHQIGVAVVLPHVMDGEHVGMVELARRARLLLEAPAQVGASREVTDALDRDAAAEPRVARAVDLAHAAGAQQSDDLVRPEAGPRAERRRRGRLLVGARRRGTIERPRGSVVREQRDDELAKARVAFAGAVEELPALTLGLCARGREDLGETPPALGVHEGGRMLARRRRFQRPEEFQRWPSEGLLAPVPVLGIVRKAL